MRSPRKDSSATNRFMLCTAGADKYATNTLYEYADRGYIVAFGFR